MGLHARECGEESSASPGPIAPFQSLSVGELVGRRSDKRVKAIRPKLSDYLAFIVDAQNRGFRAPGGSMGTYIEWL